MKETIIVKVQLSKINKIENDAFCASSLYLNLHCELMLFEFQAEKENAKE